LDRHLLKPWQQRCWIFPRDPQVVTKAGRVLDRYAGWWAGEPLGRDDDVISADEKTSIQARRRCHPSTPPQPGQPMRGEHEYARGGALAYLAAWDVRRGGGLGRCEARTGQVPFGRLVDQVMQPAPFRSARQVFWIVDNGSRHRGEKVARELQTRYPTLILVHLPTPASWLNQVEISCSIIQRKVLTPNDFPNLAAVEERLLAFEAQYNDTAVPFDWRFTRATLEERLAHLTPLPLLAMPTATPDPSAVA
jgi:hypothetical protein